jgi:hypothetical protein
MKNPARVDLSGAESAIAVQAAGLFGDTVKRRVHVSSVPQPGQYFCREISCIPVVTINLSCFSGSLMQYFFSIK